MCCGTPFSYLAACLCVCVCGVFPLPAGILILPLDSMKSATR